ncbi:MAG: hypothetical protein FWD48_04085 [Oscillospiraceae bacterium]|nr:hypothetical protein [Oscillospiraceae bacterium]
MKKILGIISTAKRYWKLILLYHISIASVCFIILTELEINGGLSLAFYCIFGSTAAFVVLVHKLARNSFNEGYQEGSELGLLDAEVHWKKKYDELQEKYEAISAYLQNEAS